VGERILGRKRYQAEQIISKLREAEVLLANAEFGTMSPYYSLIKLLSKYEPTYNPIYKIDFPAQGRGRPTNPDLVSSFDIKLFSPFFLPLINLESKLHINNFNIFTFLPKAISCFFN